jgi:urease subunit beta
MIPGEYILADGDIECNIGRTTTIVIVVNTGDRPVQVGSHFHFFEVNKEMEFDRAKAFGMRLDIPSGTAVRFEPGEEKQVGLVTLGGNRRAVGFNKLVDGDTAGKIGGTGAGDSGGAGRGREISGTGAVEAGESGDVTAVLEKALEKVRVNHFKNKPE